MRAKSEPRGVIVGDIFPALKTMSDEEIGAMLAPLLLVLHDERMEEEARQGGRLGEVCQDHPGLFGARHRGKCKGCLKDWARTTRARRPPEAKARQNQKNRQKRADEKAQVLEYYGGGRCQCGVSDSDVLTIDHIDQNGAEHRRAIGNAAFRFYAWLIKNDFPDGFRVLCFNCNIKAYREEQA